MYQLCPSILSADFNRLGEQIKILENEGNARYKISILMLWMEILYRAFPLVCR